MDSEKPSTVSIRGTRLWPSRNPGSSRNDATTSAGLGTRNRSIEKTIVTSHQRPMSASTPTRGSTRRTLLIDRCGEQVAQLTTRLIDVGPPGHAWPGNGEVDGLAEPAGPRGQHRH